MAAGQESTAAPHVLVVSGHGQGNINPLLRLAKRLASKGLHVTYSSSLHVAHRISSSDVALNTTTRLPVGSGPLQFEFFSDGWDLHDPRREDPSSIDSDLILSLRTAGPSSLSDLVRRHADNGRPFACIVNDTFLPWVVDVAHSFNIPSAVLWIQSCALFSIYYHYFNSLVLFPTAASDPDDVTVSIPGLPALKPEDLPTYLLDSNPHKLITQTILSQFVSLRKATWVLANSFEELEPDVFNAISADIVPVGPLVEGDTETVIRVDLWRAADEECMKWLDSQESGSVVYVALGSNVILSREDMGEMASGLMSTGSPFLWVVRTDSHHLLPHGFAEEINSSRGKGMVVGWCSQERVLAHRAVGCFVSHCGWNSTIEALAAGVPMIAYPRRGDQQPNAKFIVDAYRVGVRLKEPVRREELKKCIEEVMIGEKAEMMKAKALGWMEAARKAAADGGSSDRSIEAFVDEIYTL